MAEEMSEQSFLIMTSLQSYIRYARRALYQKNGTTDMTRSALHTTRFIGTVTIKAAQTAASLYSPGQRPNIHILDIGAGTGLVGYELGKVGFKIIDGLDPSQGMLEKAKQRGVYRNLYCMEIADEPLDITKDSYDVITVVGSLAENHIKGEAIQEMIGLVKEGGYIIIVSRVEVYDSAGYKAFFPLCDALEKQGRWKQIKKENCPYLPEKEGICACYQIC